MFELREREKKNKTKHTVKHSTNPGPPLPSPLPPLKPSSVAAGHSHAACCTTDGEMFVWGAKEFMEPEMIYGLLHEKVTSVYSGHGFSAALTETNRLYTMSVAGELRAGKSHKFGVLGNGEFKKSREPVLVEKIAPEVLEGKKIVQVSVGGDHLGVIVEDI